MPRVGRRRAALGVVSQNALRSKREYKHKPKQTPHQRQASRPFGSESKTPKISNCGVGNAAVDGDVGGGSVCDLSVPRARAHVTGSGLPPRPSKSVRRVRRSLCGTLDREAEQPRPDKASISKEVPSSSVRDQNLDPLGDSRSKSAPSRSSGTIGNAESAMGSKFVSTRRRRKTTVDDSSPFLLVPSPSIVREEPRIYPASSSLPSPGIRTESDANAQLTDLAARTDNSDSSDEDMDCDSSRDSTEESGQRFVSTGSSRGRMNEIEGSRRSRDSQPSAEDNAHQRLESEESRDRESTEDEPSTPQKPEFVVDTNEQSPASTLTASKASVLTARSRMSVVSDVTCTTMEWNELKRKYSDKQPPSVVAEKKKVSDGASAGARFKFLNRAREELRGAMSMSIEADTVNDDSNKNGDTRVDSTSSSIITSNRERDGKAASENGDIGSNSSSSLEAWSLDGNESGPCEPFRISVGGKSYAHPALPPGWRVIVSRSRNRPFYVHPDFGTTWHCPVVLPPPRNARSVFRPRPQGRQQQQQKKDIVANYAGEKDGVEKSSHPLLSSKHRQSRVGSRNRHQSDVIPDAVPVPLADTMSELLDELAVGERLLQSEDLSEGSPLADEAQYDLSPHAGARRSRIPADHIRSDSHKRNTLRNRSNMRSFETDNAPFSDNIPYSPARHAVSGPEKSKASLEQRSSQRSSSQGDTERSSEESPYLSGKRRGEDVDNGSSSRSDTGSVLGMHIVCTHGGKRKRRSLPRRTLPLSTLRPALSPIEERASAEQLIDGGSPWNTRTSPLLRSSSGMRITSRRLSQSPVSHSTVPCSPLASSRATSSSPRRTDADRAAIEGSSSWASNQASLPKSLSASSDCPASYKSVRVSRKQSSEAPPAEAIVHTSPALSPLLLASSDGDSTQTAMSAGRDVFGSPLSVQADDELSLADSPARALSSNRSSSSSRELGAEKDSLAFWCANNRANLPSPRPSSPQYERWRTADDIFAASGDSISPFSDHSQRRPRADEAMIVEAPDNMRGAGLGQEEYHGEGRKGSIGLVPPSATLVSSNARIGPDKTAVALSVSQTPEVRIIEVGIARQRPRKSTSHTTLPAPKVSSSRSSFPKDVASGETESSDDRGSHEMVRNVSTESPHSSCDSPLEKRGHAQPVHADVGGLMDSNEGPHSGTSFDDLPPMPASDDTLPGFAPLCSPIFPDGSFRDAIGSAKKPGSEPARPVEVSDETYPDEGIDVNDSHQEERNTDGQINFRERHVLPNTSAPSADKKGIGVKKTRDSGSARKLGRFPANAMKAPTREVGQSFSSRAELSPKAIEATSSEASPELTAVSVGKRFSSSPLSVGFLMNDVSDDMGCTDDIESAPASHSKKRRHLAYHPNCACRVAVRCRPSTRIRSSCARLCSLQVAFG